MQVALRRGQFRVAHHAEGVAEIVEATRSHAGLFLGTDEAAADYESF